MPVPLLKLDDRSFDDLMDEMRALIPRHARSWVDHNVSDPGIMLVELFAWLTEAMLYRINRVPDASRAVFLELLGVVSTAAQPALVALTVEAQTPQTTSARDPWTLPAYTRLEMRTGDGAATIPFETLQPVSFAAPGARRTLVVRQTVPVEREEVRGHSGAAHQALVLPRTWIALPPRSLPETAQEDGWAAPTPEMRWAEVDAPYIEEIEEDPNRPADPIRWRYAPRFDDADSAQVGTQSNDRVFRMEPWRNAVRFGRATPAAGARLFATYRYTLGSRGSPPAAGFWPVDAWWLADLWLNDRLRVVGGHLLTAGRDPDGLDELHYRAGALLRRAWRGVTAPDLNEILQRNLPDDLTPAAPRPRAQLANPSTATAAPPSQIDVTIVPKPRATFALDGASLGKTNSFEPLLLSPDGRYCVSLAAPPKFWPVATGRVHLLPGVAAGELRDALFSADSRHLFTVDAGAGARLWAVGPDGARILDTLSLDDVQPIEAAGGDDPVVCVRVAAAGPDDLWLWNLALGDRRPLADAAHAGLAPDGTRYGTLQPVLSPGKPPATRVRLFARYSGDANHEDAELAAWTVGAAVVRCQFSPNGQRVVLFGPGATAYLWLPFARPKPVHFALRHARPPGELCAFSPDGSRLATTQDTQVYLWDTLTGRRLQILELGAAVTQLFFSQESRYLAGVAGDRLRVWDAATGQQLLAPLGAGWPATRPDFAGHGPVVAAVFGPGGRTLAIATDTPAAYRWEPQRDTIQALGDRASAVRLQRDGRWVAVATGNLVTIWDVARGQPATVLHHPEPAGLPQAGPWVEGDLLVTATPQATGTSQTAVRTARVWHAAQTLAARDLLARRSLVTSRIAVSGPDYADISIEVTVARRTTAGDLVDPIRAALLAYLDPLSGGPEKKGWPVGRHLYRAELFHVIEGVAGVDHVEELRLNGPSAPDDYAIEPGKLINLVKCTVMVSGRPMQGRRP